MSSAARTMGRAATCARALRSADTEGRFRDARDELAGVLRDEAIRVLLMNGVPAQAREDLARAVTLNVLGRILDGVVEPGFEDGYLAVAAKNRARDWHREASGVYEKTEHYDEELLVAPDLDPCSALELADDDTRALAHRIVLVLQTRAGATSLRRHATNHLSQTQTGPVVGGVVPASCTDGGGVVPASASAPASLSSPPSAGGPASGVGLMGVPGISPMTHLHTASRLQSPCSSRAPTKLTTQPTGYAVDWGSRFKYSELPSAVLQLGSPGAGA